MKRFAPCAAVLAAVFVFTVNLGSCGTTVRPFADSAADPSLVIAHSHGLIRTGSPITVILTEQVATSLAGTAGGNPFVLYPEVRGTVRWSDEGRRVDFVPEHSLEPGKRYVVGFNFAALGEPEHSPFSFDVTVEGAGFSVEPGTLYVTASGQLALDGTVRTDGSMTVEKVKTLVRAGIGSIDVPVSWSEAEDGVFNFTVKPIPGTDRASTLELAWNGKAAGSSVRGRRRYEVPAVDSFEVLSVTAPGEQGQSCLTVSFSQPVNAAQDFRGLIRVAGVHDLRYTAEGGDVRVYTAGTWPEEAVVSIGKGIRSQFEGSLARTVSATVTFDWEIPAVRFRQGGVIVPTTQGTTVVLETRNLDTVVVEALQIHGDSMLQFLQVNELGGNAELRRVGDVVWRKELDLGWDDDRKNRWMPYRLDLSPLLAAYPEGMFQLRVAFGHDHIHYLSRNEITDLGRWKFPPVTISDDGEESSWDYYEEWFDWDEYYRYREDPAHPAFYITRWGEDRSARRNVLVSDVGAAARLEADGTWHLVATDLKTTRPLQGARVTLYSFSRKPLASATTDSAGMARLRPDASTKPFLAVIETADARDSRGRGYVRLTGSHTLSVSHFDVGGVVPDNGVKGFIYGERGVWRPGDDIHLGCFVFDAEDSIPADHPVRFELADPMGRVVRQAVLDAPTDGLYTIRTGTDPSAPTGTWTAAVIIGTVRFEKSIKIEAIMPNRLSMKLEYGDKPWIGSDRGSLGLSAAWLHGAKAPGLRADVTMTLSPSGRAPGQSIAAGDQSGGTSAPVGAGAASGPPSGGSGIGTYSFTDPTRTYPTDTHTLFEGTLGPDGNTTFPVDLAVEGRAPGPMTATFRSRVFEPSGVFSTEAFSVDFHPYERYVGVRLPAGDAARGMLLTDTDHTVELVMVDRDGKAGGSATVAITMYKLEWRWWWEKGPDSLAEESSDVFNRIVTRGTVRLCDGRGTWKFNIKYPDWGRYLIRVEDSDGGHAAGSVFYVDWPGWAGRSTADGGGSAAMLALSTDRAAYRTGQTVRLSFPSNKAGRAFVAIERAGRIIDEGWVDTADGTTVYSFMATEDMAPNVYAHVTFLQPHLQTENDLPIRLYGVVPVMVENPDTRLHPVIQTPEEFSPESVARVSVSERDGKPMTYTLAIVDEGLLGITRYSTPDPWNTMYRKEASSLQSFDMFGDVASAWSGTLQTMLTIGGSEAGDLAGSRKASRFPPLVRFMGPFTLKAGATGTHEINPGQYIGAVRCMVVAGTSGGAYGTAERTVPVRASLMAIVTAPRNLAPGETAEIPVTVFCRQSPPAGASSGTRTGSGSSGTAGVPVTVSLSAEGAGVLVGASVTELRCTGETEQTVTFTVQTSETVGELVLKVRADGPAGATSTQSVTIPVRPVSVPVTAVAAAVLESGGSGNLTIVPPGVPGTGEAWLELSRVAPIDLSGRMAWLGAYPHGCGEQITSQAFPQLFLPDLVTLEGAELERIRSNVAAAITKLGNLQTTSGGFMFWPGAYGDSAWLSAYATHFLVMARRAGYTVAPAVYDAAIGNLRSVSAIWNGQSQSSRAEQAYRLYVLALARVPDIAAMNRFAAFTPMPVSALYQLAASYALAGLRDKATRLLSEAPATVTGYDGLTETFGSDLRERSIVLDAYNSLGDGPGAMDLFKGIAADLSSGRQFSTQELSFALIAAMPFIRSASQTTTKSPGGVTVRYGTIVTELTPGAAVSRLRLDLPPGNSVITLDNASGSKVFARVVSTGTPVAGTEKPSSRGLDLGVRYTGPGGKMIDPLQLPAGSDVVIDLSVRNTGPVALSDVALTFRAPSGWELANLRLGQESSGGVISGRSAGSSSSSGSDGPAGSSTAGSLSTFIWQDIRDDRIMTYFDLPRGAVARYRFHATVAYGGSFVLPAIVAEAMYDPAVYAIIPGRIPVSGSQRQGGSPNRGPLTP